MATPKQAVQASTTPTTVTPAAVVAPAVQAPITHYKNVAAKPSELQVKNDKGEGVPCTNKRAAIAALYLLLCDLAGVPAKACDAAVISMCSKLGTYFCGYSKSKNHALLGGEITSRGVSGYVKFVTEGYSNGTRSDEAKKLLPAGEGYSKTQAQAHVAKLVVAQYGRLEGIDTMLATVKAKTAIKAASTTPATK